MPKKLLTLILFLSLFTFAPTGPAQASEPEGDIDFNNYMLDYEDFTLDNGLRVILVEDHSAPVVATDVWYHVGGANDPEDRAGFAHMFEHMMFRGSENVADGEFDALLESVGAVKNAYTSNDKTAYWQLAPVNQLPLMLWLESDRMASLQVSQDIFETERDVVIEEYNQRYADSPFGLANLRFLTQPMQGYPPYERPVIGNVDNLNAATVDELLDFHDTYYKPNNAVLTIVGDIDPELTKTLVQAYFANIPAGAPVVPITQRYPLPEAMPTLRTDSVTGCAIGTEETVIDPLVQVPRFAGTVVAPPRGNPDFYALKLLVDILSGGDSSRLEQNLVRQGEVASAFANVSDYLGGTTLYTFAYPNQGDAVEDAWTLLRGEFDKVIADGVTEEELELVKQQQLINSITSFRGSARSTGEWIQDAVLTFDDPAAIADELAQYKAVTTDDIQRVAQTYLCDAPMNTQITLTEGDEVITDYPGLLVEPVEVKVDKTPVADAKAFELTDDQLAELPEGIITRTEPPAALPVTESNFPPFESFTLDNGLEVLFVEQNEVPKLNLQLYVGGSNASVPADKQGVADFMAELLTKGTETRTAAEIAQEIEATGGSVSYDAGLEWTSLSIDAPITDAELAYNILADVAQNPIFPDKEFEVVREQTLTFLEQSEVNPDTLANHQFGRLAYGGHPYGYYMDRETVEDLSRDDAVEFYQTYYKPNNALLVVVGDTTLEDVQSQVEAAFGGWEAGDVPDFLDYPTAELGDTSVIYLVDRPDSEQATIQIGNQGINARNPDRYALGVVNTVLGSGSTSRLFSNLRDDKGYTYGVYSRFGKPNDTSTFRVLTSVAQENTADAIEEILYELDRIRTEEITAEELEDAKGLLIGNFALSIEDPADFASQLSNRYLTGVPVNELNDYLQNLEAVTGKEALTAATKYIDSEQPIIVVVGDAEILQSQLEELGQVVVVDGDGNPL